MSEYRRSNSGERGMFRIYSEAALPASLWPGF